MQRVHAGLQRRVVASHTDMRAFVLRPVADEEGCSHRGGIHGVLNDFPSIGAIAWSRGDGKTEVVSHGADKSYLQVRQAPKCARRA